MAAILINAVNSGGNCFCLQTCLTPHFRYGAYLSNQSCHFSRQRVGTLTFYRAGQFGLKQTLQGNHLLQGVQVTSSAKANNPGVCFELLGTEGSFGVYFSVQEEENRNKHDMQGEGFFFLKKNTHNWSELPTLKLARCWFIKHQMVHRIQNPFFPCIPTSNLTTLG